MGQGRMCVCVFLRIWVAQWRASQSLVCYFWPSTIHTASSTELISLLEQYSIMKGNQVILIAREGYNSQAAKLRMIWL